MTQPGRIMWQPTEDNLRGARLTSFERHVRERRGVALRERDYRALHRWSIDDLPDFWEALVEFFEVELDPPARAALEYRAMPGTRWFPGAGVSYPEHAFRGRDDRAVALVHASELRPLAETTWGELRSLTGRFAAFLREQGVGRGDRVVAYLPNVPEAVAAFLATVSLGAIWSSCSPDFGPSAVLDRFGQLEPKLLLTVDGYRYGGREFDRRDVVDRLRAELPSVVATVQLAYLDPDAEAAPGITSWKAALRRPDEPLRFERVPFEHPLWILYSSGTTGLPKGLVHSQGGILVEHLKWLGLHVDSQPDDRLFWLTTTGWTMWNFLVGGLLVGTPIVQYDGNPGHPDLGTLWDLAEAAGVTIFGAGASFYASCRKAGIDPTAIRDLSRIRAVGSTGSPLLVDDYEWIARRLGDPWIFSTSGGTDVCTAFVGGVPTLPVRRGELQAPALGVDVQAWSPEGEPLAPGQVGELVVTQAMPSMPVALWGDTDGSRLRDTYFSFFPGVWRHGDWIEQTPSGGAVIHGRSDATINRGGIRIGSAEIYRVVLALDEIEDAVVLEVPRGDASELLLFVQPSDSSGFDDRLIEEIRERLRHECSPRHVPDRIAAAPGIPRTLSGKVLETPLRRILTGVPAEEAASRDALANPEALDWFASLGRERAR
jgi:acetoacetyl-CoA synthetase